VAGADVAGGDLPVALGARDPRYLILMMSATRALEIVGGNWVRVGQVGDHLRDDLAAVILLPSGRMRAWRG
jgi:hypothetical protein